MQTTCPPLASGDAFLSSLLTHIDCQGRTLGLAGYEALSTPTSPIVIALTSALVIFVALFGMRMALTGATSLRDAVTAVLKIGIVLTLATSWPAYQTVVYDVVVNGPAQVTGLLAPAPRSPNSDAALIARLQDADRAIIELTNLGTGREEFAVLPPPPSSDPTATPQRFPIADNPAFGWARVFFLSSVVAAFAVIRLSAAVLLALTPLFAGLLLFNRARGLFTGWARALVFTALASITVSIVLNIQVALLEPWLAEAISLRQTRAVTGNAPVELLILCLGFAAALAGLLALLLRAAFMVHVPLQRLFVDLDLPSRDKAAPLDNAGSQPWDRQDGREPPSRALVVADAVAAAQRRESARPSVSSASGTLGRQTASKAASATAGGDDLIIPAFAAASRRARPRTSLGARLRDRRT